jgi:hypothetical protein
MLLLSLMASAAAARAASPVTHAPSIGIGKSTSTPETGNGSSSGGSASSSDAKTFQNYVKGVKKADIIYGPEDGNLVHDPEKITTAPSGLDVSDFIAHAVFGNPYKPTSDIGFDYGMTFRLQGTTTFRVIITSNDNWYLTAGNGDPLQKGTFDNMDTSKGGSNTMDLVVVGDDGYLGVNGEFITKLDLSSITGKGDVAVATAFFTNNFQDGATTTYKDFTVWSVSAGSTSGNGSAGNGGNASGNSSTGNGGNASGNSSTGNSSTGNGSAGNGSATTEGEYTSPTYGYTLTYDDSVWQKSTETSDKSGDYFELTNGTSTFSLQGFDSTEDVDSCVPDQLAYYKSNSNYSKVSIAKDTNGDDMQGTTNAGGGWGLIWVTYTDDSGKSQDYSIYVECRSIVKGKSLLQITQIVPFDDYNDQIQARVDILKGLDISGSGNAGNGGNASGNASNASGNSSGNASGNSSGNASGNGTPAATGGYTSPQFGYTIDYDDSWTASDQQSNENGDYVRLTNGVSTVDFSGFKYTGAPTDCLSAEFDYFNTTDGYSDVAIAKDADGKDLTGTVEGGAYEVMTFTYKSSDGTTTDYAAYVECRTIEDGVSMLRIDQFVEQDKYNDQIDAVTSLLDTLTINGASAGGNGGNASAGNSSNSSAGNGGNSSSGNGGNASSGNGVSASSISFLLDDPDGSTVGLVKILTDAKDASKSDVRISATDLPSGSIAMIHKGTCDSFTATPAYYLNALDDSGASNTVVKASLSKLATGGYVVAIHDSLDTLDTAIACGEIKGQG